MTHVGIEQDQELRQCIDNCLSCYAACTETVRYSLTLGDRHAAYEHISTLLVCAEVCRASAHTMLLGSEFHTETCRTCAEICRQCEVECRKMAGDDDILKRCADACHRCAESCARMAEMA